MPIPIVEHVKAAPSNDLCRRVERLAESLRHEHPELTLTDDFRELVPAKLGNGPTLYLDDLSEISRLDPGEDVWFYQDRARLRAGNGDLVASCADEVNGQEEYCREHLGLGSPHWQRPQPPRNRLRIAEACWEDPAVRETLLRKLRSGELEYLHPQMGTFAAWELAALLREESQCPIKVVAPHPRLTKWVNNKVAFAEVVSRLFGSEYVPQTHSAWNLTSLARHVQELANQTEAIGLKLPDAGGGAGNIILQAESIRGKSLSEILRELSKATAMIDWRGDRELLVDVWESDVVCSPSVQLWVPPREDGIPIVEGVFQQLMEGQQGSFVGTVPATLPSETMQELADRSWLLARLFQHLGYVGRCSFDLILIGKSLQDCRCEFIECNGRWGGTSLPMTLMNRIFGDWATQQFSVQVFHHINGLQHVAFAELLAEFQHDLFNIHSGHGSLIFYNPGRLAKQWGISTIIVGPSNAEIEAKRNELSARLHKLAADRL